jgi:hypothetical protein
MPYRAYAYMLACHAMLFLGGDHSVLLQHCGHIARRALHLAPHMPHTIDSQYLEMSAN